MKNSERTLSVFMCKREWILGLLFLPVYYVGIQLAILLLYRICDIRPNEVALNLMWYLLSAAAMLLILHEFLENNAGNMPGFGNLLGELGANLGLMLLSNLAVNVVITAISYAEGVGFTNMNNESIADSFGGNLISLAFIGCVFAPFVEECIFRGIIFSNLYRVKKWAGYLATCVFFIAIHIVPYLSEMTFLDVVLSVLQYLPATLFLCRIYRRTDCIYMAMLLHASQNALALLVMFLI